MKKGFTIVELFSVIAIMIIILLMAIPLYTRITGSINQKIYETKIQNVLAKGEIYTEENGRIVFDIKSLIEKGLLEPDNELGEYKDPRDNRDMRCDIVNTIYDTDGYHTTITKSEKCLSDEELESLHGMVELKIIDAQTKEEVEKIPDTDWINKEDIYITYEFKEEYKNLEENVEEILWYGENSKTCLKENKEDCKTYPVKLEDLKLLNTEIYFQVKVNKNGTEIQNESKIQVLIDKESPILVPGSITMTQGNTNVDKRVQFKISDGYGSGIKKYGLVQRGANGLFTCSKVAYKNAMEGEQTEYLENGEYSICIEDKVGNRTNDIQLEEYAFKVENVNKENPKFIGGEKAIEVKSTDTRYNTLKANGFVTATNSEGNTKGLKICLSITGFRKDCEWKEYRAEAVYQKEVTFPGDYDGSTKKVYVTLQDAAGNYEESYRNYQVYKYCNQKSDWKEVSNTSKNCPKCGSANYTSNKKIYDKFFEAKECGSKNDTIKCNIPSNCCEASALVYSAWSGWSTCSASCGTTGTQYRTRTATSKYNGQSCSISGTNQRQEQACNRRDCCESSALVYSAWSSWSTCTKTCGGGTQYRTRTATSKYNGQSCSISGTNQRQEQACNQTPCDPAASFNPNDYDSSKDIACSEIHFASLITNYLDKFKTALDYQSFRTALYDCAEVTQSLLSNDAINIMKNHSQTVLISGYTTTTNKLSGDVTFQGIKYEGKAFIFGLSQTHNNNLSSPNKRTWSIDVFTAAIRNYKGNLVGKGCKMDYREQWESTYGTDANGCLFNQFGYNVEPKLVNCPDASSDGTCANISTMGPVYIRLFKI